MITVGVSFFLLATSCGKDSEGNTLVIKDGDGFVYTTVTIGSQTWLVENLKTSRYINGDRIVTTNPGTADITGEIDPKYQWSYNGDEVNVSAYGRLYTWYVIADSRGICPAGWHVATDAEWTALTSFLGESVAGDKLKEAGSAHWSVLNTGTNLTGFSALPGGCRTDINTFKYLGYEGSWWSSKEFSTTSAYYRTMASVNSNLERSNNKKNMALSVRCIKDN